MATLTCAHVIEQVQPDLDELEVNMEDNEDAESAKSEVKLGKLQFSMDYDFQKGEVHRQGTGGHSFMQRPIHPSFGWVKPLGWGDIIMTRFHLNHP